MFCFARSITEIEPLQIQIKKYDCLFNQLHTLLSSPNYYHTSVFRSTHTLIYTHVHTRTHRRTYVHASTLAPHAECALTLTSKELFADIT